MKSLVEYSCDFEKMRHLPVNEKDSEKLLAHYQLHNKVSHKAGSIVKCGVTKDGFHSYAKFIDFLISDSSQKSIAFEKFPNSNCVILNQSEQINTQQKASFVAGNIDDSITAYLMEEPELKIAYLHIDLDDYEATLTSLQFFFPRLVPGGMLVLDNYFKREEDYDAVIDYFSNQPISFSNFSAAGGPHYFVRE